ncbi:vacuolar protein sorting-associated protein 16B isoform X2 [Sitodiplosis mosellana]|uniref:vacuolar protein sorting-associated protein 16B isoform X2 n=1 Tax=Sitodiplosis mosellana TaxID=263140 RepID=UPI002444788C|nr:vacuolar protein sorting-associated protein 16B isoform X2 [Sitodiplosis mosellana]
MDDEEEFWNKSNIQSFSFDEDEKGFVTKHDQKLFVDDNVSEISYELPASTEVPLRLIISDNDLQLVLEEQSLKETPLPKIISIEEELKILRRRAHAAPPVPSIIRKILLKKPYSFECFRALHEKESLLNEAIRCGNGDAILAVVLFLQRSLKKKHFFQIMQSHPEAVKHFINFLMIRCQVAEATEFLTMLGKSNENIILQYESMMKLCKSPDVKKQKLNKIYNESIAHQTGSICPYYATTVTNYIALLEWQLKEKINNPKLINILDASPLESLYVSCTNHKWSSASLDLSIANQSNPYYFADMFKIAQSQFDWIILNERAQSQAWCDLDKIFEKKSWHSLKTTKSFSINVPLDRVIFQLNAFNAPADVLNIFLAHIDDPHRRLAVAKRCRNAGKSIVDSLVELKNRDELEQYIGTLNIRDNVRIHAENALKNLQKSKWKADGLKLLKN